MDLTLSEEQEQLRDAVRRFLEHKSPSAEVRRLMETDEGFDRGVWAQMARELGLQAMCIPEDLGGQGFSPVELGIVLEEMGRVLLCAPFFSTVVLAANAIMLTGTPDDRRELLPPIASGQTIATLAFAEPDGRWDASGITTVASGDGETRRLTGAKSYVLDGHIADPLVVVARSAGSAGTDGIGFFLVEGDAAGLTRSLLPTMDQTRKQARLDFSGVEARRLGAGTDGWPTLSTVMNHAAIGLANEMAGVAQRVLEMSVDYAKNRIQFGRPIGSFQAIKHKCADMLMQVESAKSAAYYARWVASTGDADEFAIAASLAKSCCSEACFRAAAENIQVHGGIGFTWEHDAHLYFKRAKSSGLLFGDPIYHRGLLAERIGLP